MQQIEIHVKGHLKEQWSEWFGGLIIDHSDPEETVLAGCVPDEAAFYGIIARLRDLGLKINSLNSTVVKEENHGSTE